MPISYKKLWKLLIDKDMKKKDLPAFANVSLSTITKMSHNENVSTEILGRICAAFNCNIEDIVEFVDEPSTATNDRTNERIISHKSV